MRIALVEESRRHARGHETVASLSARPVEQLAIDLAELGHVVSHLRLRSAPPRAVAEKSVRSAPATVSALTGPLDVAPGRELSVLRTFAPDAVLGVGEGPGRALEELSRGLPTPWVWTPSVGSSGCALGTSDWVPTTAERIVVPTIPEREAVVRAGIAGSRCDVVPWSLAPRAPSFRPWQPAFVSTA